MAVPVLDETDTNYILFGKYCPEKILLSALDSRAAPTNSSRWMRSFGELFAGSAARVRLLDGGGPSVN